MAQETTAQETAERANHYRNLGQSSLRVHDSVPSNVTVPTFAQLFEQWANSQGLIADVRNGKAVMGVTLYTSEAYARRPQSNGLSISRAEAEAIRGAKALAAERGISTEEFTRMLTEAIAEGRLLPKKSSHK